MARRGRPKGWTKEAAAYRKASEKAYRAFILSVEDISQRALNGDQKSQELLFQLWVSNNSLKNHGLLASPEKKTEAA